MRVWVCPTPCRCVEIFVVVLVVGEKWSSSRSMAPAVAANKTTYYRSPISGALVPACTWLPLFPRSAAAGCELPLLRFTSAMTIVSPSPSAVQITSDVF